MSASSILGTSSVTRDWSDTRLNYLMGQFRMLLLRNKTRAEKAQGLEIITSLILLKIWGRENMSDGYDNY